MHEFSTNFWQDAKIGQISDKIVPYSVYEKTKLLSSDATI